MSRIGILIFCAFAFLCPAHGKDHFLVRQDRRNELIYTEELSAQVPDETAPAFIKYRDLQGTFNPHAKWPFSIIRQTARDEKGMLEYQKTYHTDHLGFRKVMPNNSADHFLIVAGDSNVFGIGSDDKETLSARLAEQLPATQIINLGLPGTAGNALLFFLEHYPLREVLGERKKGAMLYDFSEYLMERMIGSKNFVRWGHQQPAYDINEQGQLIYLGKFSDLWITKFYKFISLIDPHNRLFPNLPRIHPHHMKLIARIFLEIKNKFLEQTLPTNHFAVLINPFVLNERNIPLTMAQVEEFKKLGIETILYKKEETCPIEIYPKDLHRTPKGQDYYARMIAKKMQDLYNFKVKN